MRSLLAILFISLSFQSLPNSFGYVDYGRIRIESKAYSTKKQVYKYIRNRNQELSASYIKSIVNHYFKETKAENINHDVAIAQMCLETNFLKYTGVVPFGSNNFAGIGAVNSYTEGHRFPSKKIGIRAHIQHLKAYSSKQSLFHDVVDPRYKYVKKGSCKYIQDLTGKWATDKRYGAKIINLVKEIYNY